MDARELEHLLTKIIKVNPQILKNQAFDAVNRNKSGFL